MYSPAFRLSLLAAIFVSSCCCLSLSIGDESLRSVTANGTRILSLPGFSGRLPDMYSGYIAVDPAHGRRLFYWLVLSETDAEKRPIVLWLQGGPGCSGLLGLMEEHGPFIPNHRGGLDVNPYSWHKIANMLYIEAPCGVGFSYADDKAEYITNDKQTAEDNYKFLSSFMQLYPRFRNNDLYIAGESYGGVYVPMLTYLVVTGEPLLRKQLKGILVGNGVFRCGIDYNAVQFDLYYWHGLVSYTNYANWTSHGCPKNSNTPSCNWIFNTTHKQPRPPDQELETARYSASFPSAYLAAPSANQPSFDPDDLYQDFCLGNGTLEFSDVDPYQCLQPLGNLTVTYLNRPDVQKAIHAHPTNNWAPCANLSYTSFNDSMVAYYSKFFTLSPPISILVYSGDVDIATVPFAFNQACLGQLTPVVRSVQPWAPWFVNGATAGYVEYFDKYVFATLKGAGHEAPLYQPLNSFKMFDRWLNNRHNLTDPHPPRSSTTIGTGRLQGRILRAAGLNRGF